MASTSNPHTHESPYVFISPIKIRMMGANLYSLYPHCLFFLELLQNPSFHNAMAHTANKAEKEEVDLRSIYVGNVDYACKPGEVQQHFQVCGTVNRVTIPTDKLGQPKGFAYVEFFERESVKNALLLNESELYGRKLKVSAKRTNVPGMKQFRGRRYNPYAGFRPRRAFVPGAPVIPPFGRVPRFRRSIRYRPY